MTILYQLCRAFLREAEDIGMSMFRKFAFVEDEDVVGGNDRFVHTDVEGRSPLFS